MTTDGIVMLTFTPISGMSDVVIGFTPKEMRPGDISGKVKFYLSIMRDERPWKSTT